MSRDDRTDEFLMNRKYSAAYSGTQQTELGQFEEPKKDYFRVFLDLMKNLKTYSKSKIVY